MAEAKTKPTGDSVAEFLAKEEAGRQQDCETLITLMRDVTGAEPVLWGSNIVGFGKYHYRYESKREGEAPLIAFSPRKAALTVYLSVGYESVPELMEKLGKHKTGGSCLYIKRLADIDLAVLKELMVKSIVRSRKVWGDSAISLSND